MAVGRTFRECLLKSQGKKTEESFSHRFLYNQAFSNPESPLLSDIMVTVLWYLVFTCQMGRKASFHFSIFNTASEKWPIKKCCRHLLSSYLACDDNSYSSAARDWKTLNCFQELLSTTIKDQLTSNSLHATPSVIWIWHNRVGRLSVLVSTRAWITTMEDFRVVKLNVR